MTIMPTLAPCLPCYANVYPFSNIIVFNEERAVDFILIQACNPFMSRIGKQALIMTLLSAPRLKVNETHLWSLESQCTRNIPSCQTHLRILLSGSTACSSRRLSFPYRVYFNAWNDPSTSHFEKSLTYHTPLSHDFQALHFCSGTLYLDSLLHVCVKKLNDMASSNISGTVATRFWWFSSLIIGLQTDFTLQGSL